MGIRIAVPVEAHYLHAAVKEVELSQERGLQVFIGEAILVGVAPIGLGVPNRLAFADASQNASQVLHDRDEVGSLRRIPAIGVRAAMDGGDIGILQATGGSVICPPF